MRIAIMGTGGVGGYFGARLAASGAQVTFIARGEHLRAIQERGLQLLSANGDLLLHPARALLDPAQAGVADLVIIAVKLWSTAEAVREIAPMVGPDTAVVSFQNGVIAVDQLLQAYGAQRVFGGVANIAALIEAPGVIRHNGTMARLIFGELDSRRSERCAQLAALCERAGFDHIWSEDIHRAIWEKFVFLASFSGMTSLMRQPIGLIREDPDLRTMLRDAISEAVAVGRAKGAKLPADQVEKSLAWGDGLPAAMVASMLGDLQRGNRLELPWLSGAVVKLGAQLRVPTPTHRFITLALKPYIEPVAKPGA
jgi:2-dehydropantoate 2-reductase